MLDELTPEQLAEWIAYYSLEPFDPWHQTGTIAATVHNVVATLAAGLAGKSPAKGDLRSPEDYIPTFRPAKPNLTIQDASDMERTVRNAYGNR